MLDGASKAFFSILAHSGALKKVASRFGMRRPTSFARRFIAGEEIAEAIEAARALETRGFTHTLDLLGESVANLAGADAATRGYLRVVDAIVEAGVGRNISLKLTQLGLDVDKASAIDNLRRILDRAEPAGFFVRIDMENSPYTELTLEVFETMWQQGYREMGVVLQSALYRSEKDLARINALGASIRLVGPKGTRTLPLQSFFVLPDKDFTRETVLEAGEVLTEVLLQPPTEGVKSLYRKVRERASWDFALAGGAFVVETSNGLVTRARIVLSGVAPVPWRAVAAEKLVIGRPLDPRTAAEVAGAAVAGADPLSENAYKIDLVRGIVEESLLALAG